MSLSVAVPLLLAACIIIAYCMFRIHALEDQVKHLNARLASPTAQKELREHPVNEELLALIDRDEEIKAIKQARITFGMSLLDAKKYIDSLREEREAS